METLGRAGMLGPDRDDLPPLSEADAHWFEVLYGGGPRAHRVFMDFVHIYQWCRLRELTKEAVRLSIQRMVKIADDAMGDWLCARCAGCFRRSRFAELADR